MRDLAAFIKWAKARTLLDRDVVLPIVGAEGDGKSSCAWKLARKLDPTFDATRMHFSGALYQRAALRVGKHKAMVWDELVSGGLGMDAVTREAKDTIRFFITARTLNQFHLLCVPTLDLILGYLREWRSPYFIQVEGRGYAALYKVVRKSRLPGSKPYYQRLFTFNFEKPEGPDWDAYLERKRVWIEDHERDSKKAVNSEEDKNAHGNDIARITKTLAWLPAEVAAWTATWPGHKRPLSDMELQAKPYIDAIRTRPKT